MQITFTMVGSAETIGAAQAALDAVAAQVQSDMARRLAEGWSAWQCWAIVWDGQGHEAHRSVENWLGRRLEPTPMGSPMGFVLPYEQLIVDKEDMPISDRDQFLREKATDTIDESSELNAFFLLNGEKGRMATLTMPRIRAAGSA